MPKKTNNKKSRPIPKTKIQRANAVPTKIGDSQKIPSQNLVEPTEEKPHFSGASSAKSTEYSTPKFDSAPKDNDDHDSLSTISDPQMEFECNFDTYEAQLYQFFHQEKLEGKKVLAPYKHTWGDVIYHNAIVISGCGERPLFDDKGYTILAMPVAVVFTHPTHREMVPCPEFRYQAGYCYERKTCQHSHGIDAFPDELREYEEPDYGKLVADGAVLVKLEDEVWHRGRVLEVNVAEKQCRIRLLSHLHKQREDVFAFDQLLPVTEGDDVFNLFCDKQPDSDASDDDRKLYSARRDAKRKRDEEEKAWKAAHPEKYDYEKDFKIQKEKCEKLIGKKVRAPFRSFWGFDEYSNAIVQSVCDKPIRNFLTGRIEDMKVRVTYTHPTTKKMLPCPDYLNEHCIVSGKDCDYSHGVDVPVKSLDDYEEPQYERLAPRCLAKAKMPGGLWVPARILSVDREARKCRVRLSSKWRKNRERELPFEDLFPKPTNKYSSVSGYFTDPERSEDSSEMEDCELVHRSFGIPLSLKRNAFESSESSESSE